MRCAARFFMREKVLTISLAAAVIALFFVPPDGQYAAYIDWNVLMLLFSLMAVVAGFREMGLFDRASRRLMRGAGNLRRLALILCVSCFFISMLVTNDVSLMTFVPLTVGMLWAINPKATAYIVSLETVAANLGSMATPIGNPQNLYLYEHYGMTMGDFARAVLPLSSLSLALVILGCLPVRAQPLTVKTGPIRMPIPRGKLTLFSALFVLCILAVLRILPKYALILAVIATLLVAGRRLFAKIDYALLATFACFFIFVGNLARIPAVGAALGAVVSGYELETGILASQAISNVPAAIMLSGFTKNAPALLRGVNLGGLGTLVASLASLISFRLYMPVPGASAGKYLTLFTGMNLIFLAILYGFARLIG